MACEDGRCKRCARLVETLERIREMPVPKDEETAKIKVVLPLLAALGWDVLGDEVVYEYTVGESGGGAQGRRRVDIALAPDPDRPVMLIESKAHGKNLRPSVRQVLEQAFLSTADICVLTNVAEWWFYLPREGGNFSERRFAELLLYDDPLDQVADDLKACLGREALLDGSATERARQVLEARKHPELLQEQLPGIWKEVTGQSKSSKPDEALVRLVTKLVYDRTGQRPTPEQVAELLKGWPDDEADDDGDPPPPSGPSQPPNRPPDNDDPDHPPPAAPTPSSPPSKPPKNPEPSAVTRPLPPLDHANEEQAAPHDLVRDGEQDVPSSEPLADNQPIAFLLWNRRYSVGPYYEISFKVAEAIYRQYPVEFRLVEELAGQVISRDPGAFRSRQVANTGWHVDISWKGKRHIKDARRLLKVCGFDPDALQLIYGGS